MLTHIGLRVLRLSLLITLFDLIPLKNILFHLLYYLNHSIIVQYFYYYIYYFVLIHFVVAVVNFWIKTKIYIFVYLLPILLPHGIYSI